VWTPHDRLDAVTDDVIEVGGAAEVTGRFFTYPLGVKTLTDPPLVSFEYYDPNGAHTVLPPGDALIFHDGVGLYRTVVPATDDGVWRGRWLVTGGSSGSGSVTWCVMANVFV
jgi:hypothetical protein